MKFLLGVLLLLWASCANAQTVPYFTGPGGANPVGNPVSGADLNLLITGINGRFSSVPSTGSLTNFTGGVQLNGTAIGPGRVVPITTFGAISGTDNSTLVTNALTACNGLSGAICIVSLAGLQLPITSSVQIGNVSPQRGFGLVGPGGLTATASTSNFPLITFNSGTNGVQDPWLANLNLIYNTAQPNTNTQAICIEENYGVTGTSIYNGAFEHIQCTNAYRCLSGNPSSSTPGAFWGMNVIDFDCKNNSGSAISLIDSGGGSPNNHFDKIYVNPASNACGANDLFAINLQYMTMLKLDNIEEDNAQCGLIFTSNNRGQHFSNIRSEVPTFGTNFNGHGIVETSGDCTTIDDYEIQNPTISMSGDTMYLFKDDGLFGCADQIRGGVDLYQQTISSITGTLFGIDSATVPVQSVSVQLWFPCSGCYSGDLNTGDATITTSTIENPTVPKPTFAIGAGAGSGASVAEDARCNGKYCDFTITTAGTPTASSTQLTVTWTVTGGFQYWDAPPHCTLTPKNANAINLAATANKSLTWATSGGGNLPTEVNAVLTATSGTTALTTGTGYEYLMECHG